MGAEGGDPCSVHGDAMEKGPYQMSIIILPYFTLTRLLFLLRLVLKKVQAIHANTYINLNT
jgi:hypothetical protein